MKEIDIEELNKKFDDVLSREFDKPSESDVIRLKPLIEYILNSNIPLTERQLCIERRKYKFNGKRSFLFHVYLELKKLNLLVSIENEDILRKTLQIKPCKSWSGIVTITIFTAAYPEYTNSKGEKVKQAFSCEFLCSFCPNESLDKTNTNPAPRSYLKGEPAVLRANKNNFDCAGQIWDRMQALYMTGHLNDKSKLELIVSGGTWTSYPIEYRQEFCRDIYYAANTYWDVIPRRERMSLLEEKNINKDTKCRIVGLTIETRPDTIDADELKSFRQFGVTRVQLGIQHINDNILNKVNRKCPTSKTIKGIEMLKRNNYKIDAHWMLNLPDSTSQMDDHMLNDVLLGLKSPIKYETIYKPQSWMEYFMRKPKEILEQWEYYDLVAPELSCCTWKIYPTAVTPWTDVQQWFHDGLYKPYAEKEMMDILLKTMSLVYPWIRLARVIRDIPESYMYNKGTGADNTNMRQELHEIMNKEGIYCMDIRNREVKDAKWDGNYNIFIRKYNASNGDEYFISAESYDNKTLYGFVRLRLDDAKNKVFKELDGCGLIREVHVYGNITSVGSDGLHIQHKGIGKTLMNRAEKIAYESKYKKCSVIAAEGNKRYYEKLGYIEHEYFMIKVF